MTSGLELFFPDCLSSVPGRLSFTLLSVFCQSAIKSLCIQTKIHPRQHYT